MSVREAPPSRPPARPASRSATRPSYDLPAPRTSPGAHPRPGRHPSPARVRSGSARPRVAGRRRSTARLQAALLALAILLSLFAGRLVQVQGLEGPAYADRAQNERLRTTVLAARRGAITDVRGVALATSVDARDVTVDQTLVSDPEDTAAKLAPLLGLEPAVVRERITGDRRFAYVAKQIAPEAWRQVTELRGPDGRRALPGILSEPSSRRVYPAGDLAANVLGFVGQEGQGLSGLEHALDDRLAGADGTATYEVGAGGRHIPMGESRTVAPVSGGDLRLTIDRDIQWISQRAVTDAVARSGAVSGAAVVLDAGSGDVLAMASAPTFDPNRPGDAPAQDRGNRVLTEVFEPGSTGKAITAAAVVEEGVVDADTPFTVPPVLERGGRAFHDSEEHPTLELTFTGVMAKSSNIGTILAAERLSPEKLHEYYARFGIGTPSGLGLPGESRGILAPAQQWSSSQRYTVPFGQGYAVNALQMASVYATLANDGVRVTPRVVSGWTDGEGRFVAAPEPERRRVVSADTAREVRGMLEAVVGEGGTAPGAAIPGYRVAGKTGTANRVDPETGRYSGYTASFIGIAPADGSAGRRLVVAVTLQDPKNGHYGGVLAAPVFRQVMSFALQSLRLPPTGAPLPAARLETG